MSAHAISESEVLPVKKSPTSSQKYKVHSRIRDLIAVRYEIRALKKKEEDLKKRVRDFLKNSAPENRVDHTDVYAFLSGGNVPEEAYKLCTDSFFEGLAEEVPAYLKVWEECKIEKGLTPVRVCADYTSEEKFRRNRK